MATDTYPVDDVWSDLEDKIALIPEVKNKTLIHYSAEKFLNESKNVQLPAVAVVYQAAVPRNEKPGMPSTSVTLQFGVYVIASLHKKGTDALTASKITKKIIDVVKGKQAPTGHKYVFGGEFPFDTGVGVGYVHHWNVTAQFTN